MDANAIERQLREFLASRAEPEGIAAAYLFGSVARGTAGPRSDLGVGVLYSGDSLPTSEAIGLELELEKLFALPVQVVILDEAPPELIVRIFQESTLLLESNRQKRIHFEVRSRNEYWDFAPVLRLYRSKNKLPDPSLQDLIQRYRQSRG